MAEKLLRVDGYSKKLNLRYQKNAGGLLFEDGVLYRNSEIEILKSSPGFNHETIHNVKKIFEGVLIENRKDTKRN